MAVTETQLWQADLLEIASHKAWVRERLTEDEWRASQTSKVPGASHAHAACRAFVREVLARTLAPSERTLSFTAKGKPLLPQLSISWSHTEGQAFLGLSPAHSFAVDVENVSTFFRWQNFWRFLQPEERRALMALPLPQRALGCGILWVRKEAALKACGSGLAGIFAVHASPRQEEDQVQLWADCGVAETWRSPVVLEDATLFCLAQEHGLLPPSFSIQPFAL